jgi:hypothetical protein
MGAGDQLICGGDRDVSVLLHVGCGRANKRQLKGFNSDEWNEIRLDIDESVSPDIVGTLTDMNSVSSFSIDAIYSAHNIEHLYPHQVPQAMMEFYRVLKPDGFVVITCPDLQIVCEAVARDKLLEPLYVSAAGPISPIDILFGHRESIARGNEYMGHKCGFTFSTLRKSFLEGGFKSTFGGRAVETFALWLVAFKSTLSEEEARKISLNYLP